MRKFQIDEKDEKGIPMSDVKRRYGDYDQGKWNKNLKLKEYFEKRMNRNLYEAVEKDTFHN